MRTTLLSSVIALSLLGLGSATAHARQLPLAGAAYRIAEDAYAAYRPRRLPAGQPPGRRSGASAPGRGALADGLQEPALPRLAAGANAAPATAAAARAGGAPARRVTARPCAAEQAYRRAFALATQAYDAYNNDRIAEAADKAERAFRQQPQQGAWAVLWVSALEAQQHLEQAEAAAVAAI